MRPTFIDRAIALGFIAVATAFAYACSDALGAMVTAWRAWRAC